jgi:hypothetical protein
MSNPNTRFALGRKPNTGAPRITLTANSLLPVAVAPPPSVDFYTDVKPDTWSVDGNDTVGDCTCAEVDHAVKAMQVAADNPEIVSSTEEVLAAYSAITGYDPDEPDTDRGAVMQDVRDYWRRTGFTLGGKVDKILLFAEVSVADTRLVEYALSRFGEVGLGFRFPQSAHDQFNAGKPWDVVKRSPIIGGHAVALVGYDEDYYYVVTWGKVQKMTPAFFGTYVDEAWIQLSTDFVNSVTGEDPLRETLKELGDQFAELTGQPNPVSDLLSPAAGPQATGPSRGKRSKRASSGR